MRGCSNCRVDFNPIFMKYLLYTISIYIFFQSSLVSAIDNHAYTWDTRKIYPQIQQILSMGAIIEKYPESPLIDKFIFQREKILERLLLNLQAIGWKYTEASLDISDTYTLVLQKYKLSCEVAWLRMMLESLTHVSFDEDTIIASLPTFPEPLGSGGIWWDPESEFVGSITGSQFWHTGYGIYENPLRQYVESLGYTAHTYNRWSPDFSRTHLLTTFFNELELWHRIMLWWDWCTLPEYEDGILEDVDTFIVQHTFLNARNNCSRNFDNRKISWTTLWWKTIQGLSGEHVFLLLGYIGKKDHPDAIIVWDTDTGKHIFPYSEWMRKWSALDYRAISITRE